MSSLLCVKTPIKKTTVAVIPLASAKRVGITITGTSLSLIVLLTRQNQLVLYALDTLEEVVRIHQKRENQWIAVAPSGEYAASLFGAHGVNWNVDGRLLALPQTSRLTNNPDLIEERLEAVRRGEQPSPSGSAATVARVARTGDELSLSLELSPVAGGPAGTFSARATISGAVPADAAVVLELSVNGEVHQTVRVASAGTPERTEEFELNLDPGENTVRAELLHDRVVVQEEQTIVSVESP